MNLGSVSCILETIAEGGGVDGGKVERLPWTKDRVNRQRPVFILSWCFQAKGLSGIDDLREERM